MASLREKVEADGFELDPERLRPLVADLDAIYAGFKTEVKRFVRRHPA